MVRGYANGAGFLAGALWDLMVCNEEARYGNGEPARHFYPTTAEAMLLEERFGAVLAQELLQGTRAATGKQLRGKGWTVPILPGKQIEAYGQNLAATLAKKSQNALRLLKQHLVRQLVGLVKELTKVEVGAPVSEHVSGVGGEDVVALAEHIHLETPAKNVVLVKLSRSPKQVGDQEWVRELGQVWAQIQQNDSGKAVVLASEDGEVLPGLERAIAAGVAQAFQRRLMESEVPGGAALEGNSEGPGWLIS